MQAMNETNNSSPHFTGTQINYYFICWRKLWLFSHNVQMEHESDAVLQGKLLHEESYSRDEKEAYLDEHIRLDRIEANGVIHEIKKTDKMEDAHIWQLKYYLYYLKSKDVWPVSGKIDYPKLRQTVGVELSTEDCRRFEFIFDEIGSILKLPSPPKMQKKKICLKCAYYEYCFG
jgi:CRISPR-associated exonuclease Cas4